MIWYGSPASNFAWGIRACIRAPFIFFALQGSGFDEVDPVAGRVAEEGHACESSVNVQKFVRDAALSQTHEGFAEVFDEDADTAEFRAIALEHDSAAGM